MIDLDYQRGYRPNTYTKHAGPSMGLMVLVLLVGGPVRNAVESPLMAVGGKIWPVSCLVRGMLALMLAQSELGVG